MLQFGFNPRVAQRQLPIWLAGYAIPETVRTLLNPGEENYSGSFDSFWRALGRAATGNISAEVDAQIASSPWCPPESRALITSSLLQTRVTKSPASLGRIEDEERNPTIFETPRLGDSEFILSLSRSLPKELTMPGPRQFPFHLEGFGTTLIARDSDGELVLDNPLRLPIRDVLQHPIREVKVKLPGLGLYRERFGFWDDAADVVLFAGSQGRRILDPNQAERNIEGAFSLVVRPDLTVRHGNEEVPYDVRSEAWALYRIPAGWGHGITVSAGEEPIWPAIKSVSERAEIEIRGRMSARELSPTRLRLRAELHDGWICESFRLSGQRYVGAESEVLIPPNFRFGNASALIEARRGIGRSYLRLPVKVIGPPAQGAAFQTEDGRWKDLTSTLPLDVSLLEGRPLS